MAALPGPCAPPSSPALPPAGLPETETRSHRRGNQLQQPPCARGRARALHHPSAARQHPHPHPPGQGRPPRSPERSRKGARVQPEPDRPLARAPRARGGGRRSRQLSSGPQQVKLGSVTSGGSAVPAPSELPHDAPARQPRGCSGAAPRPRGWGSGVGPGGGPRGTRRRGPRAPRGSRRATRTRPPRSSPKNTSLAFSGPAPPPPPGCSNRQGRWLEKPRPQPGLLPAWGRGLPRPLPAPPPPPALRGPPRLPHRPPRRRRLGDAHLFWKAISSRGSRMFSSGSHVLYLAREEGGDTA